MGHDSELAWRLADEIGAQLADADKTAVYVELGAGEFWPATTRLLTLALHNELPLSAALLAEFATWLDRYVGGIEEPLIRDLLDSDTRPRRLLAGVTRSRRSLLAMKLGERAHGARPTSPPRAGPPSAARSTRKSAN
jgi:hypothetical protein